jgi:hypothetical protein
MEAVDEQGDRPRHPAKEGKINKIRCRVCGGVNNGWESANIWIQIASKKWNSHEFSERSEKSACLHVL